MASYWWPSPALALTFFIIFTQRHLNAITPLDLCRGHTASSFSRPVWSLQPSSLPLSKLSLYCRPLKPFYLLLSLTFFFLPHPLPLWPCQVTSKSQYNLNVAYAPPPQFQMSSLSFSTLACLLLITSVQKATKSDLSIAGRNPSTEMKRL